MLNTLNLGDNPIDPKAQIANLKAELELAKIQILELEAQVIDLQSKLNERNNELAELRKSTLHSDELPQLAIDLLIGISRYPGMCMDVSKISYTPEMTEVKLDHYLNMLESRSLIDRHSTTYGGPLTYCVSAGGSKFLVENNLV